jgi:hypothetical protein
MGVILISMIVPRRPGENFACTWEFGRTNAGIPNETDRYLGSYGYSFGGLQVLSETLRMCMSNRLPSTVNMMHGSLLIITSESY